MDSIEIEGESQLYEAQLSAIIRNNIGLLLIHLARNSNGDAIP